MYYQTTARLANGEYLYHLAQFDNLEQSIKAAQDFTAKRNSGRAKGYYAIVRDPKGVLVFDSRI